MKTLQRDWVLLMKDRIGMKPLVTLGLIKSKDSMLKGCLKNKKNKRLKMKG
jgi:hypothetical protein